MKRSFAHSRRLELENECVSILILKGDIVEEFVQIFTTLQQKAQPAAAFTKNKHIYVSIISFQSKN